MPNHSQDSILDIISNWSTDDVVELLQKNGLSECCDAVVKRQIDGDGLLHLSERTLNLWKSDLTNSLRRRLCRFVEELNHNPDQYFQREHGQTSPSLGESDVYSDFEPWDDFDDEDPSTSVGENPPYNDSVVDHPEMYTNGNQRPHPSAGRGIFGNRSQSGKDDDDGDNLYTNAATSSGSSIVEELKEQLRLQMELKSQPTWGSNSNVTQPRSAMVEQKLRAMKETTVIPKPTLPEQNTKVIERKINMLKQKSKTADSNSEVKVFTTKKPIFPKPQQTVVEKTGHGNMVMHKLKTVEPNSDVKGFASNKPMFPKPQQMVVENTSHGNKTDRPEMKQNVKPPRRPYPNRDLLPPKPMDLTPISPAPDKRLRNLPKPPSCPVHIGKLDLVADLPTEMAEDSDDYVYEPIDEQLTTQRKQSIEQMTSSLSSRSSVVSGRSIKGSNESVNRQHSTDSVEENQDADVYESISEKIDDRDEYVPPIFNRLVSTLPYHPPSKKNDSSNLTKRPQNNKFATLPYTTNQLSSTGGATRPLPSPPDDRKSERLIERVGKNIEVPSYAEKPWFHNVTRDEAIALIEGASSNLSTNPPPDGYFLLRPSNANINQPWTLVVWYRNKTYNIAVRERPDSRYALGKVKPREQSFASIEEMVNCYQHKEELVLNSSTGDAQVGSTRLTSTPPKRRE